MRYFLVLDAGTTSMKVALVDESGRAVATWAREYTLSTPDTDSAELDAEQYWQAAVAGARRVLTQSQIDPRGVVALAISSQGETLIPVAKDGTPLRPAIVWVDNRSAREAQVIEEAFGVELVHQITGQPQVVPTWPATKVLWLKQHEPTVFQDTWKYCMVEDFLLHRLTGAWVGELSVHSSTLWLDINHGCLWPDMLRFLGVDESVFPDIRRSGEIIGPLLPAVAHLLGLSSQTVVVSGALDQPAGAIGAGNIRPGICSETTGAALAAVITLDEPLVDPDRRLPCHMHGVPGKYYLMPWGQTAGLLLKWFRDNLCPDLKDTDDAYDKLVDAAASVQPGCDGLVVLPHITGAACPEFDPSAKGVFFGISLLHTRAHFVRAILESVAYMLRKNLSLLPGLGIQIDAIRSLGGGSRSSLWNTIKADVTGTPVITLEASDEAACVGAAMIAAVATGVYSDLEQASEKMVRPGRHYSPAPQTHAEYEQFYQTYLELYDSLAGLFQQASRVHTNC